jgi:hypothetical protein
LAEVLLLLQRELALLPRLVYINTFWGVSNPLCLSSSSALHFFRLFFLGPPPC